MTPFIKRGTKSQVKPSQAFKHALDWMPTSKVGYLSPRSKRTKAISFTHRRALPFLSYGSYLCALWLAVLYRRVGVPGNPSSHPWPGTTAETIAVLHAVTCRDGFVNCLFTHQCLSQSMARCRTLTKCLLFKKNWGVLFLQVKQHKTRRMQVLSIPQTDFFFFFLVLEDIVTAETAEVLSCFQRALWWGIQCCSCGTARDTWLGCKKVKNRAQRARMSVMKLLLQQNGKC